jgi:hypothetical protein
LARCPIREEALDQLDLLRSVVQFKERFYPSKWSRYDLAKPGSFRLLPDETHLNELRRDYQEMQMMLFGEPPGFANIMRALGNLERQMRSSQTHRQAQPTDLKSV